MKRFLLLGLGVVLLAVGAGVLWFTTSIDGAVARAIEQYGGEALGTRVQVSSVEIRLREGRGTIRGLRVANPAGFSSAEAISFEELTLAIDPNSILESPIVISQIRLVDPRIRFELDAGGKSNLDALKRNVEAYAPASEPAAESAESASSESAGPADEASDLRLRIAELSMEKGQATADLSAVGDEERQLELPSFQLSDIGGKQGVPPPELAQSVALELTRKLSRQVAAQRAKSAVKEKAGELLDKVPGASEAVDGLLNRF